MHVSGIRRHPALLWVFMATGLLVIPGLARSGPQDDRRRPRPRPTATPAPSRDIEAEIDALMGRFATRIAEEHQGVPPVAAQPGPGASTPVPVPVTTTPVPTPAPTATPTPVPQPQPGNAPPASPGDGAAQPQPLPGTGDAAPTPTPTPTPTPRPILTFPSTRPGQPPFVITNIAPVAARYSNDLSKVREITANNGIDEIYLKDPEGKLYVAFGRWTNVDGATRVRRGEVASLGANPPRNNDPLLTVEHVDDETNTTVEHGVWASANQGVRDAVNEIIELIKGAGSNVWSYAAAGTLVGIGGLRVLRSLPADGRTWGNVLAAFGQAVGKYGPKALLFSAIGAGIWVGAKGLLSAWGGYHLNERKFKPSTIATVLANNSQELHQIMDIGQPEAGRWDEFLDEILRRMPNTVEAFSTQGTLLNAPATTSTARGPGVGPQSQGAPRVDAITDDDDLRVTDR